MSRVTYTDMTATHAQDALRGTNKVRLVTEAEEGTGVNALPVGVYGFTYSPGLSSAPLFAVRRYRSFEIHKVPGETLITSIWRTGPGHAVFRTEASNPDGSDARLVLEDGTAEYAD